MPNKKFLEQQYSNICENLRLTFVYFVTKHLQIFAKYMIKINCKTM